MGQYYSNYRCLLGLAFVILSVLALSVSATEDNATLLQQRAIARIDAVVEHFRKTGDFRSRVADLRQAETELTDSNQAFKARGDRSALAHGLVWLGKIQQMQANWESALVYYRQVEDMAQRANDIAMQVKVLTGMAKAEAALRDYGSAVTRAAQAVKLSEHVEDKKLLFDALSMVGQIQVSQGNLNAAADTFNRAFEVAQGLKEESSLLFSHLDRADVYFNLARECDYQAKYEACLEAIERARADYQAALNLAHKLGYTGLAKFAEGFLGNLQLQEQLVQAQQGFDRSLRQTTVFAPRKAKDVLVTEEFVVSGALPPGFETLYRQFEQSTQHLSGFGSPLPLLYLDGLRRQSRGDHDGALQSFLQAVDLLERDRGKLRDERDRGTFMEDKVDVYYKAILQLLQRRRHVKAFELLERSRSRAMADLLASRPLEVRAQERGLYGEAVKLKSQIAALQSKLPALTGQTNPQARQDAAALSTEIGQLEGQYQALVARMAKDAPRLNELLVSEPASLDTLQRSMRRENYEVLQYLVLEQGIILWHVSADAVHVLNVFLPRPQVIEKVAQLRNGLEIIVNSSEPSPTFDVRTARELFLFLVQPVKQWLKADRLVIIPHGDLHQVPFQVLQDPADGRFLGESHALSYAPSATVLLGLKKAVDVADGRLLAIAAPDLVAAQKEVEAIAKLYPGRAKVVKKPLAKEADIKAWVGDYDIVHLAVHGKFEVAEPLLSYIELEGGGQDDGRLTAAEIFGLPLDKARLVVLSACETGKAEVTHGNEVLGMMRALVYAGAGALVLSFWPVESDATAVWMENFYRVARSAPPAEAARQALQAVKSRPEYQHPYFWAAFMTVGR